MNKQNLLEYTEGDYLRAFVLAFTAKYQPSLMNSSYPLAQLTEQLQQTFDRNDIKVSLIERLVADFAWSIEHNYESGTAKKRKTQRETVQAEILTNELTTQISRVFDEEFRSLVRWIRSMLDINAALNMAAERYSLPATESRAIWPVHQLLQTKLRQQQDVSSISTSNPIWASGTHIDFLMNSNPVAIDPWLVHLVAVFDSAPGKIGLVTHNDVDCWVFMPTKQAYHQRIYPTLFPDWLHKLIFRVHRFSVPLLDTIDAK